MNRANESPEQRRQRHENRNQRDRDNYNMNRANESPEQRRQRHENRNQRGRDQRENETPDQQLARQQHRNESDYARRENETSEEKQQLRHNRNEFDQAHHAAAVASGEASGDGRYDRHRQLVDAERRAWSVTSEEFFRELEEKKGTFLDDKIEYDPFKAVVMYYLNSGIARFEGLTEFDPMFSASSTRSTTTKTKPKQTLAAPNLPGTILHVLPSMFHHIHRNQNVLQRIQPKQKTTYH